MSEHEEELRRTSQDEDAPDEQGRPQQEINRTSRASGGDAPAAASADERAAVAADEDHLFDGDEQDRDDA